MDLSALIFVALAVAWTVYLVPKALRHHEEDAQTRSVDRFSDRMRVLARREAVSPAKAELVVGRDGRTAPSADVADPQPTDAPPAKRPRPTVQRRAGARAARRRRRVLGVLVLANLVLVAMAVGKIVTWPWVAVPGGLLVAWLVACRVMVKRERAARRVRKRRTTLADEVVADEVGGDDTAESGAVAADDDPAEPAATEGWDPVPITLPTYVAKAPVGRTVRTIDLDSTGVWSSGRNAVDSQLAREADQAERDAKTAGEAGGQRATGT